MTSSLKTSSFSVRLFDGRQRIATELSRYRYVVGLEDFLRGFCDAGGVKVVSRDGRVFFSCLGALYRDSVLRARGSLYSFLGIPL